MKRKRAVLYLIIFAMAVSLFAVGTSSQAKKKSVSLNYKKLTLQVGQKRRLTVRGTFKKVNWSSSNRKVAAVSEKGVVRAKKKGDAVITAKMENWKQRARIIVKAKKEKDVSSGDNESNTKQPAEAEKPEDSNGDAIITENEKIPEELQEIPACLWRVFYGFCCYRAYFFELPGCIPLLYAIQWCY